MREDMQLRHALISKARHEISKIFASAFACSTNTNSLIRADGSVGLTPIKADTVEVQNYPRLEIAKCAASWPRKNERFDASREISTAQQLP